VRILLVSVNREVTPEPVAPLGISYIAGAARAHGHEVALLDLCFARDVEQEIDLAVRRLSPELIGISIRNVDNLTYPASVSYLDEIRVAAAALGRASHVPIVAGGAGFSIFPERLLAELGIEYGVIGEGEETFCLLARSLGKGAHIPRLPNLIRRGESAQGVQRQTAPLNGNGRPARDLLENSRYREMGGMSNLQTKRGCPFRCLYCTYPQIDGASLRLRPPGEVVDEMASLVEEGGVEELFFVDDVFNWPLEHAMDICEEIAARNLRVGWTCFATPLGMSLKLARAMKRAGCRGVEFGVDSASPSVLRSLGKPFGPEEIRGAARVCREAGLPAAHYLIFGGPGETTRTVAETFAVHDDLGPQAVLAFLGIRVYPGTPLQELAVAQGVIAEGDDLLEPRFYISPGIGAEELTAAVRAQAGARPNWVVPGLGIRSDPGLLTRLRRTGHRGPLWGLLPHAGRW
jgi:radical SAM superfamily enzyme YgiQ (UPF0313 family)